MAKYRVLKVTPTVYLDKRQNAVNGVLIDIELIDFDEVHAIRLPNMDEKAVKIEAEKLLVQRENLAKLSSD